MEMDLFYYAATYLIPLVIGGMVLLIAGQMLGWNVVVYVAIILTIIGVFLFNGGIDFVGHSYFDSMMPRSY